MLLASTIRRRVVAVSAIRRAYPMAAASLALAPRAFAAAAAAKPAAKPAAATPAPAASGKAAPAAGLLEPAKPKIIMKKGLTTYLQAPAYEVVAPALKPYMSKYQLRACQRMKPIQPIAFKLYGDGLKVNFTPDNRTIEVEAKMGKTSVKLHESVTAVMHDGYVVFSAVPMHVNAKAMMGTLRTHLANAVHGVHFGHTRRLRLVGIGYRAKVEGQQIEMRVGFSHAVFFDCPAGVVPSMPAKDVIQLKGIDIHQVMLTAAQLRLVRPPNVYTGQGIRYTNEKFVAKPGKKKST